MDRAESLRWKRASDLLTELLKMPAEKRQEAAQRLGSEAGVLDELNKLLASLEQGSLVDEDLDSIVECVAPEHDSLTGQSVGEWEVCEEIGRGGMSVVYRAIRRGERFEQVAALKVLSIEFLSKGAIESFHRECQALSALNHPGIARLIHSGMTLGNRPYMIIEHIDGMPVDEFARQHSLGARECARLMLRLTRAVSHAHRHSFVHRDIKPENVLVDHRGDPHLLDFGVVEWLEPGDSGNALHAYSPGFAAPEQVAGGTVSTAVDVYSLGKLLDYILEISGADPELTAIATRATRQVPEERYPNATDLAADLDAWLGGSPVKAVGSGLVYRGSKFARRNWRWLGLAGALVLAIAIGIFSTWQKARDARLENERHQAVADFMLGMFQQADILAAGAEMKVTDLLEDAATQAPASLGGQPEVLVSLYTLIASGQTELTNYEAAQIALEKARELVEAGGISSESQAAYRTERARLLYELGEFESAAAHAQAAMDQLSPFDRPADLYFEAGANRVSYLVDSEEYKSALQVANALDTEIQDAEVAPGVMILLAHRRAVALEVNGEIEQALEAYLSAIEMQQGSKTENALSRAQILNDYGIALYSAGQFAEAETVLRETIDIFKAHFNDPHPRVSSAMHNLAFVIFEQGRVEEASEILETTYAMSVALHGEDHLDTVLERVTYAVVLQSAGEVKAAESIYGESLQQLLEIAPEMKVMRGNVHTYLADLRVEQSDLAAARAEYEQALALYAELPPDHPRVTAAEQRLAEVITQLDAAP